jgi:hypothetical protein
MKIQPMTKIMHLLLVGPWTKERSELPNLILALLSGKISYLMKNKPRKRDKTQK